MQQQQQQQQLVMLRTGLHTGSAAIMGVLLFKPQ
jgi:hypothetical protein